MMRLLQKPALVVAMVVMAALALPAVSSATTVTNSNGVLLPVGTKVTAKLAPFIRYNNILGRIDCAELRINGEIIKNDRKTVEWTAGEQKPVQSGCEDAGAPYIFQKIGGKFVSSQYPAGTLSLKGEYTLGEKRCGFTAESLAGNFSRGGELFNIEWAPGMKESSGCGTDKITTQISFTQTGQSTPLLIWHE